MKVLFIGDIVGGPGRKAVRQYIGELRSQYRFDCCIANAENAAGGSGITYATAQELYGYGIDAVTMGNHTWSKKEINTFIDADPRIARPANYPAELPGKGTVVIDGKLGVISLLGRIYMEPVDCPFRTLDRELEVLKRQVRAVIVDFTRSYFGEMRACLVRRRQGQRRHRYPAHVQTADERILPCGTAFISDRG